MRSRALPRGPVSSVLPRSTSRPRATSDRLDGKVCIVKQPQPVMSRGSSPYLKISPVFRTALQGRALWETAEQLGQIGPWEWNTRVEKLVWWGNRCRLFGYEPGEVEPPPERAFERIHPADLERVRDEHGSVQDGNAPSPLEYRVVRPDGVVRRLHAAPVVEEREPELRHRRIFGLVRDITEQRCAEHAVAVQRAVS